jgi:hypothetical protein
MKNLKAYVDQKNRWDMIFGRAELKIGRDNQKIAESIDSDLSPENLTCDGEAPIGGIRRRYQQLTAAARELKQLDPTVKFYEYSE